jgi:hypothetical protein
MSSSAATDSPSRQYPRQALSKATSAITVQPKRSFGWREIAAPDFVARTNHMTRLALSTVSLAIVLEMTHPLFADPLANSV